MSYQSRDESVQDAARMEFYEFVGTYKTYRYCGLGRALTLAGNLYSPADIKPSDGQITTQQDDNTSMDLDVPMDLAVVKDYGFNVAPPDLVLNIYRLQEGDDPNTAFIHYWSGNVQSIALEGTRATIKTPSQLSDILSSNVPRPHYQRMCNNTLFDSGCKLPIGPNSATTTITDIVGYSIVVASTSGLMRLLGGKVVYPTSGEARSINQVTGNTLGLTFPFSPLVRKDAEVLIVNGCGHRYVDCEDYDNTDNFGGTKDIPEDNIFTDGL